MSEMKVDLSYLSAEADRHGNERLYVRRNGRRIRIREEVGSDAFAAAYTAALAALSTPQEVQAARRAKQAMRGTLRWLGILYFGSEEFQALDRVSQRTRRHILEACFRETVKDGSADLMGDCPLSYLTAAKVKRLRDVKKDAGTPGAANNRRKYISAMCGWAVENGHLKSNPARDVRRIKYASSGFHTWAIDEVRQFIQRHPLGTKPYLAMALLLFVGARRGDMVTFGRQHIRSEMVKVDGQYVRLESLCYVARKTRHRRQTLAEKPIIAPLRAALDAGPLGNLTFLVTTHGAPFTANGFGNWFRERCDEAGLPQCSAHGLKKAGATIAAENGATLPQLMAMFDWVTEKQALVYIKAADRKRLAGQTMHLLAIGSQ